MKTISTIVMNIRKYAIEKAISGFAMFSESGNQTKVFHFAVSLHDWRFESAIYGL